MRARSAATIWTEPGLQSRSFRRTTGLRKPGVVDGETEALIFSAEYRELTTGDSGDDVKRIQERLIELEYYNGKVSGDYLEGTTYGIKLFQEKCGLTGNWNGGRRNTAEAVQRHGAVALCPGK